MRILFIGFVIALVCIGSSNAGDNETLNDECGHKMVWSLFFS
jgi:hypothetical protein